MKYIFYLFAFCILLYLNTYTQPNFWNKTNGPPGGIVTALLTKPNGQIFAGTGGGVFRSTDNGENWVSANNGLTGSVSSLAFNSVYIFAGTDEGVFKSADNGSNWIQIINGITVLKVTSLAVNAMGHIFAGAYDSDIFSGGIFLSTDNGNNWTKVNNGISFPSILCLAVHPNGYIFAGLTVGNGIYRSTNNGDNWTSVYNNINVQSFSIDSSGNLFAAFLGGVKRSTDFGVTWEDKKNGLTSPWIYSITINSDGRIIAGGLATSGGTSAFSSSNNGDSWVPINGLSATLINSFTINNNNFIFAGTEAGVFRSTNNGANWTQTNNGIAAANVSCLVISSTGNIFTGNSGSGVSRSTDNGNTWTNVNNGLDLSVQCLAINKNGHLFVGTYDAGIFRSTDNGDNWTKLYDPAYHIIYAIAINDSGHIFIEAYTAYGSRVLLSTNNGDNWIQKNNGLADDNNVMDFAFNKVGHIFAGTSGDGIFRSTDYGENWTAINNGVGSPWAGRITISPNGYIFVSPYYNLSGIYRSTNNGDNWEAKNVVSGTTVQSLVTNSNRHIFAGTYGKGIFRSRDNGDTWEEINTGLSSKIVQALDTDLNDYIFAGTLGGGVFKSINSTTSLNDKEENSPSGFSLSQNYPNPFNPSTTIKYSIPNVFANGVKQSQLVTLKVYDVLGNEVTTLVNEEKTAGSYEVELDGSKLSSGVYFYKLEAAELGIKNEIFSNIKKLIILK